MIIVLRFYFILLFLINAPLNTLVDKEHSLPSWYAPGMNSEAREALDQLIESMGLFAVYPDMITPAIWKRVTVSQFLQIWLPYLSQADKEYVLADSGLEGEYHTLRVPDSATRYCGSCGEELVVAAGAVHVLCEACGHVIDVSLPEFPCPSCSTPLSIPISKSSIQCPSCNTTVQAVTPLDE